MEHASNQDKSAFATEPVGRLIVKFAIPCVISLVVNALYNIVDQIFIGWGVGYLGNGATNIVFPITIIALALAVLIGDGGAAYLSLKLGEGDLDSVKKGVGNAAVMITIASIAMLVITIVFMNPILTLFGATDVLRPAALEYGYVIAIGLPFTMISTALNAMIRADGSPKFAMVSMLLGAIINTVFDPIFIFIFDMGVCGAAIATILGQIISFLVSIFYLPRFKTFHFDRSALRLHKRVCLSVLSLGVSSFITQIASTIVMALFNNLLAVYLQAIGKPIKSAVVTLSRQIVFLAPVALLLPKAMGVFGVLWAGPTVDALAFILALAMIVYEMKKLKKMAA